MATAKQLVEGAEFVYASGRLEHAYEWSLDAATKKNRVVVLSPRQTYRVAELPRFSSRYIRQNVAGWLVDTTANIGSPLLTDDAPNGEPQYWVPNRRVITTGLGLHAVADVEARLAALRAEKERQQEADRQRVTVSRAMEQAIADMTPALGLPGGAVYHEVDRYGQRIVVSFGSPEAFREFCQRVAHAEVTP